MIRTYSDLVKLNTFEERYAYLALTGITGASTFGFDRYLNQAFYTSSQWKHLRNYVIVRDEGCDLGIPGYEIHYKPIIHHMNPMTVDDLVHGNDDILDPEYLITTTHRTHNAIHYGKQKAPKTRHIVRRLGDTKLW